MPKKKTLTQKRKKREREEQRQRQEEALRRQREAEAAKSAEDEDDRAPEVVAADEALLTKADALITEAIHAGVSAEALRNLGRRSLNVADDRAREEGGAIQHFFTKVGRGAVKAQEELDRASAEYLQTRPPESLPSVFRIPKVTAELRFDATYSKESGFNVFLVSSENRTQQSQQHKISFDIVSAPPPPEVAARLHSTGIAHALDVSMLERDHVFDILSGFVKQPRPAQEAWKTDRTRIFLDNNARDRVIMLRASKGWVLFMTSDGGVHLASVSRESQKGVERVTFGGRSEKTAPSMADPPARFAALVEALDELANLQQQTIVASPNTEA